MDVWSLCNNINEWMEGNVLFNDATNIFYLGYTGPYPPCRGGGGAGGVVDP